MSFFCVCVCTILQDVALDEVKKVCIYLGPLDHECKDVIDKYFSQMWQLLQQELVSGVNTALL